MNYDPNTHTSQESPNSTSSNPQYPPFYQPSTPRAKPTYHMRDILFAWLSIAVGILFVRAMPLNRTTLGALLFFVVLYAFGGVYLRLCGLRPDRSAYLLVGGAAILSLGMITGGNLVIRGFLALFLILSL